MRINIAIKNYYRNPNCKNHRTTSGCTVISSLQTIKEISTAKNGGATIGYAVVSSLKNITEIPTENGSATIGCAVISLLQTITGIPTAKIEEPPLDAQ